MQIDPKSIVPFPWPFSLIALVSYDKDVFYYESKSAICYQISSIRSLYTVFIHYLLGLTRILFD